MALSGDIVSEVSIILYLVEKMSSNATSEVHSFENKIYEMARFFIRTATNVAAAKKPDVTTAS